MLCKTLIHVTGIAVSVCDIPITSHFHSLFRMINEHAPIPLSSDDNIWTFYEHSYTTNHRPIIIDDMPPISLNKRRAPYINQSEEDTTWVFNR